MKLLPIAALVALSTMHHASWTMKDEDLAQQFITQSTARLNENAVPPNTKELLAMGRGIEKILKQKRDSTQDTQTKLTYMIKLHQVTIQMHLLQYAAQERHESLLPPTSEEETPKETPSFCIIL